MNPGRKVSESESRLQRERDAALSNAEEQKRKLTDLYTKIGQLWEENHTLKENIKTSSNKEKNTDELCETCEDKDAKIAQLQQQLDLAGESSEESREDLGLYMQNCGIQLSIKTNVFFAAGVRPKTDPDAAHAGLHIAFFKSEEELRTKDLEHATEKAKIKVEHEILVTRLQDEVRDAHKATKKERTEKLLTREQLSNITKELSDTKKQLFDSEEQYRKFYDIIPKPGGGRMTKPPLPAIPRSDHIAEAVDYLPSAPQASSFEPTDHSHRGHSQDNETSPTSSHISDGSEFGRDEPSKERILLVSLKLNKH
ncbi:uncharacterized protein J4E87_008414 [Alternaria ethzedia]|uniref:uncharacterized protein n=1 Tax=Alternaria ethzedia TaxID=181014 RepID=UPI0020C368F5|nr:uncharacterized protein J4E87_008414 [Alternaria ethzedia]KAI4617174.1 hypothetical protein J4E87_008414 [Alternaria ethzedia]